MKNFPGLRVLLLSAGFICGVSLTALAQNEEKPGEKSKKEKQAERNARIDEMIRQEEEGALIFHKQSLFGVKLYSDGWAGLFEKGILKTPNKTNLFALEIGERKDRKEERVSKFVSGTPFLGNALIYGKQNNFYFLKLGVGQSYLIGGKGIRNGVAVQAVYMGGVSMGFLKPYYLDIVDPNTGVARSVRYKGDESRDDSLFLDPSLITGGTGVFKGFNELKVKPGLFAKGSLRFDYGRYNELIAAIEAGFNVEYYFSEMPIMVDNPAKKLFANVFVAVEFGKRK